jgi:hypothetical protein
MPPWRSEAALGSSPLRAGQAPSGRSSQSGHTSAPIIPHFVQTALRHRLLIAVSSGQRSASPTALWWQYSPAEQWISTRLTPCERIRPSVTGGPRYFSGRRFAGGSSWGSRARIR